MDFLRRILTLPKASNSLKDLLGIELWQRWERDLDATERFYRACVQYLAQHPENAERFVQSLLMLLTDNTRLLRQGLTTADPFFAVRNNTRNFARAWQLEWNG